jgi:sigma-B regulation protein RsbU (phosphoserine phosphatase)
MVELNRALHRKVERRMFVALCLLLLDPGRRRLELAVAGLCGPLLRRGGEVLELAPPGPRLPLGALPEIAYETCSVALEPGDVVVVFSDGVVEARGRSGGLYGYEAPRHLLAGLDVAALSARDIGAALLGDLERFTGGAPPGDDVALLVLRVVD